MAAANHTNEMGDFLDEHYKSNAEHDIRIVEDIIRSGYLSVGICGTDCVVLGVEKNYYENGAASSKVRPINNSVAMISAGLHSDAELILSLVQAECVKCGEAVQLTVKYIAKLIAQLQQEHPNTPGGSMLAVSCLIGGFDEHGLPHLYHTEPLGTCSEWKTYAIGSGCSVAREFLDKEYTNDVLITESEAIRLAIKALLTGGALTGLEYFEIFVIKHNQSIEMVQNSAISEHLAIIEMETCIPIDEIDD